MQSSILPVPVPRLHALKSFWPRVLVKELHTGHVPKLKAHFQALAAADRYLRFGYPISDKGLDAYVERINFGTDAVFGVFDDALELVGVAHLASMKDGLGAETEGAVCEFKPGASAEFGVSVLAQARGKGIGSRMFERAIVHARNAGINAFYMQCLSVNATMMHIATKAGMRITVDSGEVGAWLTLPDANPGSLMAEAVEEQLAVFDLGLKRQITSTSQWLERTRPDWEHWAELRKRK
jgi:RimJ/RimL family protein N-acetyltransferase